MRPLVGVLLMLLVGMASHLWARPPAYDGRDTWPLAGMLWQVTEQLPGGPACAPGETPIYVPAYMWLELYEVENYGGFPERDVLVDQAPVPPSALVRFAYPMRPGTTSYFRTRTRTETYHLRFDPVTNEAYTDTSINYGCWSPVSTESVPAWATRWGTIDDVPFDGSR